MYLVPLAKLGSKYYLACERCERGNEVPEVEALRVVEQTKGLPSHEQFAAIWNAFDTAIEIWWGSGGPEVGPPTVNDVMRQVGERLRDAHSEAHIHCVADRYVSFLKDQG
jgi:hypothetical protein